MKNTANIKSVGVIGNQRIFFVVDIEYVDVVAGDSISVTTDSGLFNGNYKILLINRGAVKTAKLVVESQTVNSWELVAKATTNPNETGTITVVSKIPNRPQFWRYYDEYITPLFSAVYDSVFLWVDGRTTFSGVVWDQQFPAKDYQILSDSGKYSGVHRVDLLGDYNNQRQRYIFGDIPFAGTDSGILVYYETPVENPLALLESLNYDKPVIDTTSPVQTVTNPTDVVVMVTTVDSAGNQFTQKVEPQTTVATTAQPVQTPNPAFVVDPISTTQNQLKSATMIQPDNATNTTTPVNVADDSVKSASVDYKPQIDAKMEQIKADTAFITLIRNNYKNGSLGYTQTIATNAVKELKQAGIIPMSWQVPLTWDGDAIWGQKAWVQANYPFDNYIAPVSSTNPPVIDATNPNPGATPTTNPNPGNTTTIPVTTAVIPVTTTAQQTSDTVQNAVTAVANEVEKEGINPIIKLILVVLGIVVIVKLIKR